MEHTNYTIVRTKWYIQQTHSACTDESLVCVYRWGPWPRVQERGPFLLPSLLASLLPCFLASFLPSFLACLLACWLACLLACLLPSFLSCLLACLLPCFLASFLACLLACFLPSFLACLLACCLFGNQEIGKKFPKKLEKNSSLNTLPTIFGNIHLYMDGNGDFQPFSI